MKNTIYGMLSFIGVIFVWEAASYFNLYPSMLVPPPSQFSKAFIEIWSDGTWIRDMGYSFLRYGSGLLLGNILGISLGFLTGRIKIARDFLTPILNYLRAIPAVALVPPAIVWFGIGEMEKIFIVTWGCTYPVWLNTFSGTAEVEYEYEWAAKTLGVRGLRMYTEVYFPRAMPFILAGSRVSVATGFFAMTAAEMAGAYYGLGFRIFNAHEFFRTDIMMLSIVSIGAVALTCDTLFVRLARVIMPWWGNQQN